MEKQEFCMEKSQIFQEMISRISKLSQDSHMGVRSFPALFYIHLHTIPMESPEILQYFLEQMLNYAGKERTPI